MSLIKAIPFGLGGGYWFILILLGVVIDWIIGDPPCLPHPIVLMGKMIGFLDKKLNRGKYRKIKGFLLLFLVMGLTVFSVFGIQFIAYQISFFLYSFVNLYLITLSLAAKTLGQEVLKVMAALKSNDLDEARKQVGYLVGRDTKALSEKEIIRATIETTAENTIDGILAPLFYLFIGAFLPLPILNPVVLVMLYKAVNTLDSMVGYIQKPYQDFGFASAKFDDLINYLPARIGSLFMLLAGFFMGYSLEEGYRIYKRDRLNHKSPNSANPESVIAGFLGIQLGGINEYFGEILKKPTIGDNKCKLDPLDIRQTVSIMYGSQIMVMLFSIIVILIIYTIW